MKFEEALPYLFAGKVALLPGWHEEQGLAWTNLGFEWVNPAWTGFRSDGILAYISPEMESSQDWQVIESLFEVRK